MLLMLLMVLMLLMLVGVANVVDLDSVVDVAIGAKMANVGDAA